MTWLLLLQLFAFPVTNAYAVQVKQDVVVMVTYETTLPITVCVSSYSLDDPDLLQPLDSHCWTPTTVVGDIDTWKGERLDMVNFKVTVRYADKLVDIALKSKLNS